MSRQLVTNSSRYGLTSGGYQSEWLSLTVEGHRAASPDVPTRDRLEARFALAIVEIAPFNSLYEHLKGRKLPTHAVIRDHLGDEGYDPEVLQEAVETFIVNTKFLGLLRTISGAERLISIEQALEEVPHSRESFGQGSRMSADGVLAGAGESATPETTDWDHVCFYISPIGDDTSECRQHSDMVMGSLVEPAVEELGLKVVRADSIDEPGFITTQVLEHLARSRLVIADLSFHNPNVFYELALRHASGLPAVHLIRTSERVPFDLDQMRTIRLDLAGLYSFVPQIETYRAEITAHARAALEAGAEAPNPLSVYYPAFAAA